MAAKKPKPTTLADNAKFIKRLRTDPLESLPRVMLWLGQELFLKRRALEVLQVRIIADQVREFVFERIEATDVHGDSIAGAARSMPMMSQHKLVVVDHIDQLRAGDLGDLSNYCKEPAEFTTLVMMGEVAPKGKFWTAFPGNTQRFDHFGSGYHGGSAADYNLFASTINQIILEPFNKRIEPEAIETLVSLAGSNLSDLKSHLEKLALHMGDGPGTIGEAEVLEGVHDGAKINLDALSFAILDRKTDKALTETGKALDDGANVNYLLAILAGWFRLLIRVKSLHEQGKKKDEMAVLIKAPPQVKWLVPKQIDQLYPRLRMYCWSELMEAIDALAEIDLRTKSESVDERELLESFILRLHKA